MQCPGSRHASALNNLLSAYEVRSKSGLENKATTERSTLSGSERYNYESSSRIELVHGVVVWSTQEAEALPSRRAR
jgi:hypothetical protein